MQTNRRQKWFIRCCTWHHRGRFAEEMGWDGMGWSHSRSHMSGCCSWCCRCRCDWWCWWWAGGSDSICLDATATAAAGAAATICGRATFICNMRHGNVCFPTRWWMPMWWLFLLLLVCCSCWWGRKWQMLAPIRLRGRGQQHSAARLDSHLNLHYKGNTNCTRLFVPACWRCCSLQVLSRSSSEGRGALSEFLALKGIQLKDTEYHIRKNKNTPLYSVFYF